MNVMAPIAVFAFNRPRHLERLFASLDSNPEAKDSAFHVFCDGPRGAADEAPVAQTHEVIDRFASRHRTVVVKHAGNRGLAQSITGGIETVLARYDRFIVLEDDLVVSPHFLRFMNRSLDLFRERRDIGCVSGYMYPVRPSEPRAVLLPFVTSWGWATWADRWRDYNPDGRQLARAIEAAGRRREFDLDDSFHCWGMLMDQIHGWSSSWWIRWYASLFLKRRLSVWPGVSLVSNKGMDGTGTHCGTDVKHEDVLGDRAIEIDAGLSGPAEDYLHAIKLFLAQQRHSASLLAIRRHLPRSLFKVLRPIPRRFVSWRRSRGTDPG